MRSMIDRVARGVLSTWTENPQAADQIVDECIAYALDEYAAARDEIDEAGGIDAVRDQMLWILRDELEKFPGFS